MKKSQLDVKLREKIADYEKQLHAKQVQFNEISNVQKENMQGQIDSLKEELNEAVQAKQNIQNQQLQGRESQSSDRQVLALKNENYALHKEIEELKMVLDDLNDERSRLNLSLNELKSPHLLNDKIKELTRQNEDKDRSIRELNKRNDELKNENNVANKTINDSQSSSETRVNAINNRTPTNSKTLLPDLSDFSHHFHSSTSNLEATEVDYLRQIVYAYMTGTDPLTMAKVIVAVLKFSDEESRKVLENENKKQSWFPNRV